MRAAYAIVQLAAMGRITYESSMAKGCCLGRSYR